MRVLIVDDDPAFRETLALDLQKRTSYEVVGQAEDGPSALRLTEELVPDLVLMDVNMSGGSGIDATRAIKERFPHVQVMALSGMESDSAAMLEAGACGFLVKGAGYRLLLDLELENRVHQRRLEGMVKSRASELWNMLLRLENAQKETLLAREETVVRLALAAELHDDETPQHIDRVSEYAQLIATRMGLDGETCDRIRWASMLHDIGKIGLPDAIVMKPTVYTPEEHKVMQQHCEIGYKLLYDAASELLQTAAAIARCHHERYDGTGYPHALKGEEIPLEARIVAVADVFDALTTDRIWRKALPFHEVLEVMKRKRGSHFDPAVLDVFMKALPTVLTIKDRNLETSQPEQPLDREVVPV